MSYCDSTIDADPLCPAWTQGDPWPWHGCAHPASHNQTGGRGLRTKHKCKCGIQWDKRGRIVQPDAGTTR